MSSRLWGISVKNRKLLENTKYCMEIVGRNDSLQPPLVLIENPIQLDDFMLLWEVTDEQGKTKILPFLPKGEDNNKI